MKKIAMLSATMLMCASSAFAFTNNYAGYTINNKSPEVVFQSEKLYGYMHTADTVLHTVSFLDQDTMSKILDGKFTDALFDETCAKVAILAKADAKKAMQELPLLNPKNYAKADSAHKQMLENDRFAEFSEKVKPEITVGKLAGRKTINISFFYKHLGELAATQITLLCANNNIYMLSSTETEDIPPEEGAKPKLKEAEKNTVKVDLEPLELNEIDPVILKTVRTNHQKFTKLFKLVSMSGKEKDAVVLTDSVANKTISLPLDWGYGQFNHKDKVNPSTLSLVLPNDTFANIGLSLMSDKLGNIDLKNPELPDQEVQDAIADAILGNTKHVVALGTYKLNNDKAIADALKEPMLTKLQVDGMLKYGKKQAERIPSKYFRVNDLKHRTNFTTQYGEVELDVDTTVMQKYDFMCFAKGKANPNLAMVSLYLRAKVEADNATAQKLQKDWKF